MSPASNRPTSLGDEVTDELIALWRPPESADELGRIGGYRILKVLGAGGMGAVFLAEDMQLQRRVALKFMRPRAAAALGAPERFLREARAAAALRHDHIITIYQVGEEAGVPFLAMDYLEGESLDDRLKLDKLPPMKDVLRIGHEIAEGLAAAHARGLIHRDIKPANVWLESGHDERSHHASCGDYTAGYGRVKLLDFGLARSTEADTQLTSSGMIIGTPSYMAPEQANGEKLDARADLFSLGVILYRMTTGQLPFPGKSVMEILKSLATTMPTAPQKLNPAIPSELSGLIGRLLAKDRDARPGSAREVARELSRLATLGLPADSSCDNTIIDMESITPTRTADVGHFTRRSSFSAIALAAVSVIMVVGAVLLVQTRGGTLKIEAGDGIDTSIVREQVTIRDTVSGRTYEVSIGENSMRPGVYEILLHDPASGLKVSTDRVEIQRGNSTPLRITLQAKVSTNEVVVGHTEAIVGKPVTLEALAPERIPNAEKFDWQPKELVAVIGEHRLRHWGRVVQVCFHPSGQFFITVPDGGAASLWMTSTLERRADAFVDDVALSLSFDGLEFSQDGKWLSSANQIYSVDMMNPDQPQIKLAQTLSVEDHQFGRSDVAIHGNRWLTIASERPGELMLWDISVTPARYCRSISFDAPGAVSRLSWSSDGRRLVASHWDGAVRVWDIDWKNPDEPEFTLRDHQVSGVIAVLSPQGPILAAGGEGYEKIELWDTSPTPFKLVNRIQGGREFAFSSDGKQLAVASGTDIQVYAEENIEWVRKHFLFGGMAAVISLAWSPDHKTLVAGDQSGGIHVWDLSGQSSRSRVPNLPAGNVRGLAFAPDGKSMIVLGSDNQAARWNLDSPVPSRVNWNVYCDAGHLPSYSPDSQLVRVHDHVWDQATEPPSSISDSVNVPARFAPEENGFISWDGKMLVESHWELTKRGRFKISGENALWKSPGTLISNDAIETLQFEARRFATRQDDQTVCVWSLSDVEKPLHELKHNLTFGNSSRPLTLSADGKVLLVFSQQASIVWDLQETPPREYPIHLKAYSKNAFFSNDTSLLYVADEDGVGVYDWVNNREVRRLRYPGPVRQIVRHPDGLHLATANGNGTVYILRMPELLSH